MDSQDSDRQPNGGRVFVGLVIILIGLALVTDRTGFYELHLSGQLWPLILVALGTLKVLDPGRCGGRPRSRRGGVWLLYVGCWGLVSEFHLVGFDYRTSWPLLVIGAGIIVVWRALEKVDRSSGRVQAS
jgi:hypothetical protein